jgi:hypothetical protein
MHSIRAPLLLSVLQQAYFSSLLWTQEKVGFKAWLAAHCEPLTPASKQIASSSAGAKLGIVAQYSALTIREWRTAYRDLPYNMGRILTLIGLELFYGLVYINIYSRATDVAGLQSLVSAIFNTTAYAVRN